MVGGGACSTHFRDLKSSQMLPTHHSRSTSPPCLAMADFTLLANWTASSSACEKEGRAVLSAGSGHRGRAGLARGAPTSLVMGGRYQTLQTMAQLVIILSRYVTIPYLLLFQKASPN